jgi:hypothetical protein
MAYAPEGATGNMNDYGYRTPLGWQQILMVIIITTLQPPTSAEVKKMWIYTSTPPYAFMA